MKLTRNHLRSLIKEEIENLLTTEAWTPEKDDFLKSVQSQIPEIPDQEPFQPYKPTLSTKVKNEIGKARKSLEQNLLKIKNLFKSKNKDIDLEDVFTVKGDPAKPQWPDTDEEFEKVFGMPAFGSEFAFLYWRAWGKRDRLKKHAQENPEMAEQILAAIPIEDEEISLLPAIAIDKDESYTVLPAIPVEDSTVAGLGQTKTKT